MNRWVLRGLQLISVAILLPVGLEKVGSGGMSGALFEALGMEPHGRILVGLIEIGAALLLLSPQAAVGALLAVGVMLGAIIAHTTVLGLEVDGDGGRLVMMLVVVLVTSATVLVSRRGELPIIGETLGDGAGDRLP